MRTTRLDKLNDSANEYKAQRLKSGIRYGFLLTSDGWRSSAKRQYHNYILLSVEGPIFLSLEEVTGRGGTGDDVKDGFERQMNKLDSEVSKSILLGVTDTPTANQKAWRLLEAAYPKQFWVGCAAHEVSLLFKEWVKKIPDIHLLFKEGHRVVKWILNHSELLNLFRTLVPAHFDDKRRHCISLYLPGDTRMATVFKMLFRIQVLWPVLMDLANRPEYEIASQKALKQWSDSQKPENKLTTIQGKYVDKVKQSLQNRTGFKEKIETFISSTKSTMYLLRLVDGQTPVLGKFYYCCALVDKHLRVMKEAGNVSYIDMMRAIFMKRWKRWHRPIHTFAYALDPCYQSHELTRQEKADCVQVIKKMGGADWPKLKVEFDRWRTAGQTIFPKEVWDAADKYHGYQWWESFGDDFEYLNTAAIKVLSKAISASACEFNWSDVGHVVTKQTTRFTDNKIDKIVNVRAMYKMGKAVNNKVLLGNLPKLDDFLDILVDEAISYTPGGGDDVADAEQLVEDSSGDEDYDIVAEDEEPLYALGGGVNTGLDASVVTDLI